ncbi:GLPGLI family protein [Chitinophaga horti]|uniref:GLPGLI family protein n=1 Tax=Chitinophaga horti TaxID=2920382 RepID=A0ABY6J3L8_9BACT|nr:GLPGLI family protein [Chitinophaga horti]UYQ92792.1 GLPGLI family protein [Chitinophaga horti]
MNWKVKASLLSTALLSCTFSLSAQETSGVITYETMSRMSGEFSGRIMMRAGGSEAVTMEMPDVITTNQVFTFNGIFGKLANEQGSFSSFPMGAVPAGGRQTVIINAAPASGGASAGSARPSANGAGQGLPQFPFTNATYIDLSKKQFLQVVETTGEKKEAWFAAEPFKAAEDFKEADKTKKIAGFNCKKATAKLKDETFTIWYTTEIPLTFSPINGLVPPAGGFVLSAESSSRSFVAKKVEMKPVQPGEVMPPATADKVETTELANKRRQLMEKFHNEQIQKQQQ